MSKFQNTIPILRIVGDSNTGKTRFAQALIKHFATKNFIAIKHSEKIIHQSFDKDSSRLFEAGANAVIGFSKNYAETFIRFANDKIKINSVIKIVSKLCEELCFKVDLIIVEGAKKELDVPTIIVGEKPRDLVVSDSNLLLNIPKYNHQITPEIEKTILKLINNNEEFKDNLDQEKLLLAIDPGREKVGWAVLTYKKQIIKKGVCFLSQIYRVVGEIIKDFEVRIIVIGDSKIGSCVEALLKDNGINLPIYKITEKNSTMEARKRYFLDHPPNGIWHFLPLSLQVPSEPIDDYAAVIIGERFIDENIKFKDE